MRKISLKKDLLKKTVSWGFEQGIFCLQLYTFCLLFILFSTVWNLWNGCGSTKFLNTDPIWIQIYNTGFENFSSFLKRKWY